MSDGYWPTVANGKNRWFKPEGHAKQAEIHTDGLHLMSA